MPSLEHCILSAQQQGAITPEDAQDIGDVLAEELVLQADRRGRDHDRLAALALAATGLVVAVKRSAVLFTTVIGGELFRDDHLLRKSVACAVMISGVYLLALV